MATLVSEKEGPQIIIIKPRVYGVFVLRFIASVVLPIFFFFRVVSFRFEFCLEILNHFRVST